MTKNDDSPPFEGEAKLTGDYLLIAGSALYFPTNHLMKHLPPALTKHVENLDVVAARSSYSGPVKSRLGRFLLSIRNVFTEPRGVSSFGRARVINGRRLLVPVIMHWLIQDIWLYWILRKELRKHYRVVIAGSPDSAIFSWFLKRSGRAERIVYYDYDYFPYVHDYRGFKRIVHHIVAWRERFAVAMADEVISVSRPLVELRYQQGAKLVTLIPNGVDTEPFLKPQRRDPSLRPPTIIYTGTVDNRWGIDLAVESLPRILRTIPDTRLVIVGDGQDVNELQLKVAQLQLQGSVDFLGRRPYEELPSIMAEADIGIASSRPDVFRRYASPLKLVEYMAAGLAVICSGGGEAEMMVEESGAGVNIEFSPEAFADAAIQILSDPERLSRHRLSGIEYAQGRTWNCVGQKLREVLERNIEATQSAKADI